MWRRRGRRAAFGPSATPFFKNFVPLLLMWSHVCVCVKSVCVCVCLPSCCFNVCMVSSTAVCQSASLRSGPAVYFCRCQIDGVPQTLPLLSWMFQPASSLSLSSRRVAAAAAALLSSPPTSLPHRPLLLPPHLSCRLELGRHFFFISSPLSTWEVLA